MSLSVCLSPGLRAPVCIIYPWNQMSPVSNHVSSKGRTTGLGDPGGQEADFFV